MKRFILFELLIIQLSIFGQPNSEAVEQWTMPEKIVENGTRPYITWDGQKLYYLGYGGINYLQKTDSGWSAPIQLGPNINNLPHRRKLVLSPDEKTLFITATQDIQIYRSFWNENIQDWDTAKILLDNGINSGNVGWEVVSFLNDTTMILSKLGDGRISFYDSSSGLWSAPAYYPVDCCPINSFWGSWISPDKKKYYKGEESFTLNRGIDLFVAYMMDSMYSYKYSLNISIMMDSLYKIGEIQGHDELRPFLTADGRTMYFEANYDGPATRAIYESKMFIDENGDTVLTNITDNNNDLKPFQDFIIYPPYPNPFNSITTIKYQIKSTTRVSISIHDIIGKEVLNFSEGEKEGGIYTHHLDLADLSSGTYILSVKTKYGVKHGKILLIK